MIQSINTVNTTIFVFLEQLKLMNFDLQLDRSSKQSQIPVVHCPGSWLGVGGATMTIPGAAGGGGGGGLNA